MAPRRASPVGGSPPNDCFADVLGLATFWVTHTYPACSQHAPDEQFLTDAAREGVAIMAALIAGVVTMRSDPA